MNKIKNACSSDYCYVEYLVKEFYIIEQLVLATG